MQVHPWEPPLTAPTQYIVLHRSCRGHHGVLACQTAHAAGESIRALPVPEDMHVVALVADTSADLEQLSAQLAAAEIDHVLIREPDPPYNGAATALGIAPVGNRDLVREYLGRFEVLR